LTATQDLFAYVITYFGAFPDEDQMTLERAIKELVNGVEVAMRNCRNENSRHWLQLALREIDLARSCMDSPHAPLIAKRLQAAREYFDLAVQGKKAVTNFIVGSDGRVERVPEKDGR
jgi:hypothetical protein